MNLKDQIEKALGQKVDVDTEYVNATLSGQLKFQTPEEMVAEIGRIDDEEKTESRAETKARYMGDRWESLLDNSRKDR